MTSELRCLTIADIGMRASRISTPTDQVFLGDSTQNQSELAKTRTGHEDVLIIVQQLTSGHTRRFTFNCTCMSHEEGRKEGRISLHVMRFQIIFLEENGRAPEAETFDK